MRTQANGKSVEFSRWGVDSGSPFSGQMLYARWKEICRAHSGEVALWHFAADRPVTFRELDEMCRAVDASGPVLVARSGRVKFLPTLIAGWRTGTPVVLVEGAESTARPISGRIPAGTSIVKQTCGAAGVERSLFFTEAAVLAEAERNVSGLGLRRDRRGLAALSMAHSYGFGCLALPLLTAGIPVEVIEAPFANLMEGALDRGGPVFCPAVPALWKLWYLSGVTGRPEIDLGISAGAPLRLELERMIYERDRLKVHNFYGTSETGAVAFDNSLEPRADGSILGSVLNGVTVQPGQSGYAEISTDGLASGSDSREQLNDWESGRYVTTDRLSFCGDDLLFHSCEGEAINVAGRKVSPSKVRDLLDMCPGVKSVEISAKQSRDAERVEEVLCKVDLTADGDLPSVKAFAAKHLESYEMPRFWKVSDGD